VNTLLYNLATFSIVLKLISSYVSSFDDFKYLLIELTSSFLYSGLSSPKCL